jgi:hypothetical protein
MVTGILGGPQGAQVAPTFQKVVTGPTNTGSILDVYDTGTFLGVPMEGGCNTVPSAIAARQTRYQNAFAPATFKVTTTP